MTDSKGDTYIEGLFRSINDKNAEIERLREANSAALAVLPVRRNPTNDLQRLVNLAAGMLRLDDAPASSECEK